MSRCSECDPSFGCFDASSECRKPDASTVRAEPPKLIVRVGGDRSAFEIRQTEMGDVECWTEMDDGYRDHFCDFGDDETTVVEGLADEIVKLRELLSAAWPYVTDRCGDDQSAPAYQLHDRIYKTLPPVSK